MSRSLYARLHRRFGQRLSGEERRRRVRDRIEGFRQASGIDRLKARPMAARAADRPSVVVVGGGFGGMAAGYFLSRDFNVTVLEARARLGGRVRSLEDASTKRIIEGGAELIGYDHPLWLYLAEDFELGLSVLTGEDDFAAMGMELPMYLNGELVPPGPLATVYDEMNAAFEALGTTAMASVPDPGAPWTAPNAWSLDQEPLSTWIAGASSYPLTQAALEAQFANNNGQPSSQQSYLANLALIAGGSLYGGKDAAMDFFNFTENVRCERGNQSLAYALAQAISENGGQVLMSNPVSAIAIGDSNVQVTAPGGVFSADYVVLATPQTMWPGIDITPEIGPDYVMGQGLVVKYLSTVASRFWIPEGMAPSSVSESYGMTWEGTDNQMQAAGQTLELSLFAGGVAAMRALELWTMGPNELHAFYDQMISQVYPGYPQQRAEWPRFMHWPFEEWTRTGYSCPRPGDVCLTGPLLAAPFAERLFFAGEHASPAFFGYMEGALQSGLSAARRIMDAAGV